MSTHREKQELAQRLAAAERWHGRVDAGAFGDGGLSHHVEQLREELARMADLPERLGKVELTFDGPPVWGQQGIRAGFAGRALESFQKLVGAFSGTLGELFVTAPAIGSFGFVLEEIGQQSLDKSMVAESLDEIGSVLNTLVQREAKGIETLEAKHRTALRDFMRVVASAGARTKLSSGTVATSFGPDEARWVAELVDMIHVREFPSTVVGRLEGVLPFKRRFEFASADGQRFDGALAPELDIKDVKPWDGAECSATIVTVVTEYPGGQIRKTHRLDGVGPSGTTPAA